MTLGNSQARASAAPAVEATRRGSLRQPRVSRISEDQQGRFHTRFKYRCLGDGERGPPSGPGADGAGAGFHVREKQEKHARPATGGKGDKTLKQFYSFSSSSIEFHHARSTQGPRQGARARDCSPPRRGRADAGVVRAGSRRPRRSSPRAAGGQREGVAQRDAHPGRQPLSSPPAAHAPLVRPPVSHPVACSCPPHSALPLLQ